MSGPDEAAQLLDQAADVAALVMGQHDRVHAPGVILEQFAALGTLQSLQVHQTPLVSIVCRRRVSELDSTVPNNANEWV